MFPIHDENPIDIIPYVTYVVLGTCIAVFLWQFSSTIEAQNAIVYALGVTPAVLFGHATPIEELAWVPKHVTVLTSMFLHGGWMHLIGNMLFLWVFGNNIEAAMGSFRFLLFYLLCGAAAVLAQGLPDTQSIIPMIGASGAISGVLGAYLLLYPKARVTVVIPIVILLHTVKVPALFVLGIWFLLQLYSSFNAGNGGGVAFGAHVGGFIAGMVLIPFFKYRDVPIKIPFVHFNPLQR